MKDSVEKWYNDKANGLNVIPPYSSWENIERTMEDWPKHWYQSNFEDIQSTATEQSWQSISQQLQVQRNAKIGYRNHIIRTSVAVSLLVLLPLWIANVQQNSYSKGASQRTGVNGNETIRTATSVTASSNANGISTPASNDAKASEPIYYSATNVSNTVESIQDVPTAVSDQEVMLRMNTVPVDQLTTADRTFTLKDEETVLASVRYTEPNEKLQESVKPSKWLIGPTAVISRSSLRNPLTFRKDVEAANILNVSFGLSASRRFGKNALSADLLFHDVKSQRATLNMEEVTTSLNHITLGLHYERYLPIFKKARNLQPELFIGAGVFGSYQTNASVVSSYNDSYFGSFTYKNHDLGGVLTAGTQMNVSDKLKFGISGRLQSGVVNLFEGRKKVPSNLFQTHSLVVGLQAKLSYSL